MAGKNKNSNNMSISGISPEIQEKLKVVADKRGISVSKLIRDLLVKNYCTNADFFTVIFSIPADLKQKPEELRNWLKIKCDGIVNSFSEP